MSRKSQYVDELLVPATSRDNRGDTLLEVLIALLIIGLTAAALLTAFSTAIISSRVHRDIATNDQVLRSVTESAFSQIQQDANPKYISCGTTSSYQSYFDSSSALPSGSALSALYATYTITVDSVQYWDSSNDSFSTSCALGSTTPQLITITMTPPYGSASQFQLTVASQGSVSSVTVMSASPTSASIDTTTSVTVNGSGFNTDAAATFNCQGGAYPATTNSVNGAGTTLTASLTVPKEANPGGCTISVVNTNGTTGTSGTIFSIVGPVAKFRVNVPSSAFVGMPFSVTLTAEDSLGNVVTSYSGSPSVDWSCTTGSGSSCTAPALPTGFVDFTNGTSAAMTVTLNDPGSNVITATEIAPSAGITGSNNVLVAPLYLNWSNPSVTGSTCTPGSNTTTALSYTGCGKSSFTFSAYVALVDSSGNPFTNTGSTITLTVTGPTSTTLYILQGKSTSTSTPTSTTPTPLSESLKLSSGKTVTITVSSPSFSSITATFKQ